MDELVLPSGGRVNIIGSGTLDDYLKLAKANFSKGSGALNDVAKKASGADDFIGTLRGQNIQLKDVKIKKIKYVKRVTEELKQLRNSVRKQFLNSLAENEEVLRKVGLSETDIVKIKNGRVPDGWQVHHKLPLDDSETNDFDNLVLIKNEPWHKVITNHQNSITKGMKPNDIKDVDWPIIEGNIYPKLQE